MEEEFEEFLKKKKPELRKMKDSDFVSTQISAPEPTIRSFKEMTKFLSKTHQMDVMEIDSAIMSYGMEALEKLIQKKGPEYAKNLMEEVISTNDKGDFKKVHELIDQMKKDINDEDYIRKGENGKNLSFEEFIKINEQKLTKKFDSFKDEDFKVIKARNPENPEEIIELDFHKSQIDDMRRNAVDLGIPFEEFAFLTVLKCKEVSENTSAEEKNEIKEFLNRHFKMIENNAKKDLQDTLEKISLEQLKEKLIELHKISRKKLDKMEKSWKKEFKEKELSSQYRSENMYIKIKFASMLKSKM